MEFVLVKISFGRTLILVSSIYIPPSSIATVYLKAADVLSRAFMVSSDNVVLCFGDFNIPHVEWIVSDDGSLVPVNIRPSHIVDLLDAITNCGLFQMNSVCNFMGRCLDLLFSNTCDDITISKCPSPLSIVDRFHEPLDVLINVQSTVSVVQFNYMTKYDFSKADFCALNLFLRQINWDTVFEGCDVDTAASHFYDILFVGFDHCVPMIKSKLTEKYQPWFNKSLKSLKNRKSKAHKMYCRSRSPYDYAAYASLREQFKTEQISQYNTYIQTLQLDLTSHPTKFWSYAKSKLHTSNLPAVINYNDKSADNLNGICDLFKEFFSSVYVCNNIVPSSQTVPAHLPIGYLHLSESDVLNAIIKLDTSNRCAPDNVPPVVLVKCAFNLFSPLTRLFNKSLYSGTFPTCWKTSSISVIFKSGLRTDTKNYRGICKLPTIGKLFESIVTGILNDHFLNYISSQQHGFTKGRSVNTNLVEFVNTASNTLARHAQLDVVYTDFSKAFDKINHVRLFLKLSQIGVHSSLLSWLKSYLSNRRQYVEIKGVKSDMFDVTSGVPQGSHLGPLLFNLFINDVVMVLKHVNCLIYADDIKLFMSVHSHVDSTSFQHDLVAFGTWCTQNDLYLNVSKCKHMCFFRKRNPVRLHLRLFNNHLEQVDRMRDLGVIFVPSLSFSVHIDFIVSKSMSMLGFVKRVCYNFTNVECLKCLFFAFVRSHLEFACVVWSPDYAVHSRRIESVQKQFVLFALRRTFNRRQFNVLPSYDHRCNLLNICSLSRRRMQSISMFVFDVLTNKISCPYILSRLCLLAPSRQLRTQSFFHIPYHRTNYERQEPIIRMCIVFNDISYLFDFDKTRLSFKQSLRNLE